MSPVLRALPPLGAALLGALVLWTGTDGLRAFTAESARRIERVEQARPLPDVTLMSDAAVPVRLSEYGGRLLVVDFIYTRCPTVCSDLGASLRTLHREYRSAIEADRLVIMSISFDPAHDGPAELAAYVRRFTAEPRGWVAAVPVDRAGLDHLLEAFGITVIADEFGGWTHNDAIHVVDQTGVIRAILDTRDLDGVRGTLERLL